ncbi:MAG: LPS assembly protein LptD, partial [Proteobacteria bacterium]|nr:LPS assembly protein LptD [Pseudomonadota bacterium]
PRVGMPMRLFDALEFYPEVGYQEALYATDAQDFAERGVFTARADLTARMRRSFDTGDGSRVTHRFAPQVGYVMARQRGQSGDPIFVPPSGFPQHRLRQLARENVVLDPADRVRDSNALSLGFLNRLYASARDSGERLAIEFSLSGMYDFENSDSTLIILDGRTFGWWSRLTTRFNLSYSPVENRIEEGLLDLSYRLPKWRFIGGNIGGRYRYLREIPPFFEDFRKTKERFANFDEQFGRIDQFTARMRIELGRKWAVGYVGTYDIEGSELITNRGYVEYQSRCECWAIQVEAEQDERSGLEFTIRFAVLGLGDDSRRPFSGRGGLGEVKF